MTRGCGSARGAGEERRAVRAHGAGAGGREGGGARRARPRPRGAREGALREPPTRLWSGVSHTASDCYGDPISEYV